MRNFRFFSISIWCYEIIILYLLVCVYNQELSLGNRFKLLSTLLPERAIMIEAGAQYGQDSKILSTLRPNGILYCFEPEPSHFSILKEAVADKTNIKIFQLALSNHNNKAQFYINNINSGSSTLSRPAHDNIMYQNIIEVQCITLEKWANDNNVDRIDFMWLDMEGHELSMLEAVPDKLLNSVYLIFIELNKHQFWPGIPLYLEVKTWLEQKGFQMIWEENENPLQTNTLFKRKKID